jgi:TIR domain
MDTRHPHPQNGVGRVPADTPRKRYVNLKCHTLRSLRSVQRFNGRSEACYADHESLLAPRMDSGTFSMTRILIAHSSSEALANLYHVLYARPGPDFVIVDVNKFELVTTFDKYEAIIVVLDQKDDQSIHADIRKTIEYALAQGRSVIPFLAEEMPVEGPAWREVEGYGLKPRRLAELWSLVEELQERFGEGDFHSGYVRLSRGRNPARRPADEIDALASKIEESEGSDESGILGSLDDFEVSTGIPTLDEVHLGASTPPAVSPGETFVARFAAYTDTNRDTVREVIEQEAPTSRPRLDLDRARWRRGAKVTVRLECSNATVLNPVQTFLWTGSYNILRFDVSVAENLAAETLILRFDVAVEELPIISLRPEIAIKRGQQHGVAMGFGSFVEARAPKSAFASYVTSDRQEVLSRIRSVQISTGIDVFVDCLSIRPGERWKPKLKEEISNRDIFWLFWSREAMKSPWVDWEWRTALAEKTINGIQPHPLEPSDLAPAPKGDYPGLDFYAAT